MTSHIDKDQVRGLRDAAAIVGVGWTPYAEDYGRAADKSRPPKDAYALAARAFVAALRDSGLGKTDIDGFCAGGTIHRDRLCEILGLDPQWGESGSATHCLISAVTAIAAGLCTTVACVYGFAPRSSGTVFGGNQAMTTTNPLAYYYYSPWGMSSQGALIGMMYRRYQLEYGITDEQLAAVPIAFRKHASLNPDAIMRTPITLDDYLANPYIVDPLRRLDYCLVNDGGVAFIVRRADFADDGPHSPIYVSGMATSERGAHIQATQLRPRMLDFYYTSLHDVGGQIYGMAGVDRSDVDVYAAYDAFSPHILYTLEGMGHCGRGEAGAFVQDGRIEIGGELPCNTSGGMLSETYMQGWNHQVELVRQLRGGLGLRQVEEARVGQYVEQIGGKATSIIYTAGN